jgi:hypothetical protein
MIDEVLVYLRDHLNAAIKVSPPPGEATSAPETVRFIEGDKWGESVTFPLGAVSELLVNIEQEHTLRRADPYLRLSADGGRQQGPPDIRMNLYVLFVAHFKQYADSLRALSRVVRHFQTHRVFNRANSPGLSSAVDHLVMELVTLPFAEQNEIWGALRTSARPSLLYRVRMVVFREEAGTPLPEVKDLRVELPA